jgi:thioredoxin
MIEMNKELFQQLAVEGEKPVLVEFWAPWCVYCRRIAPALKKVAKEMEDKIQIAQVNIDDVPELAHQERIEVIPTLVIYHKGEALASIVAPESKARIEEFILDNIGV